MPQMTHFQKLSFCSGGNLVRVKLVYMRYNISDNQALFCFVLTFYAKNQGFCTYKKGYSTFPSVLSEF